MPVLGQYSNDIVGKFDGEPSYETLHGLRSFHANLSAMNGTDEIVDRLLILDRLQ